MLKMLINCRQTNAVGRARARLRAAYMYDVSTAHEVPFILK